MPVDTRGFSEIIFHPLVGPGFVYILYWASNGKETPFYVGETNSSGDAWMIIIGQHGTRRQTSKLEKR